MLRKIFIAGFAALMMASSANAGVILGLLLNPASTAGVAASTRSGAGSWQLYAIEDAAATDLGISSYSITMTGTSAINHRSPNGSFSNSDGDTVPWGFSNLRSATGANPIVAAQPLPSANPINPILIQGFGQTASNATAKITAGDPGATGISASSGANWGAYNSLALAPLEAATNHKWVFIAEGLAATPDISVANVTVYSAAGGGVSIATTSTVQVLTEGVIPEPATLALVGVAMIGGIGFVRRRR